MIELHAQNGMDIDVGSSPEDVMQDDPFGASLHHEETLLALERCIEAMKHARLCHDDECKAPSCKMMKRTFLHMRICRRHREKNFDCPICKQFIALCCYHAKTCQLDEDECLVVKCGFIKRFWQNHKKE